ncbi:MFS transporter [Falsarthrobacter nasiphocae]|uniref:MHS family proline/betaine transporter-like MFS transporter n=1 Tax=Falsarthrobacter nasiphocae TaxID=189863 RepID=A0AAE3YGM7_9MICC|nr:MFS transporter [Falsarthrobacter nasiphocae]MDR6891897.1 MHS family proline/betaine transporter-like MFS transporter [Falsarthrobacter nasiphocae]
MRETPTAPARSSADDEAAAAVTPAGHAAPQPHPDHPSHEGSPRRKAVVASAAVGQFVEFYDFLVYAYVASSISHHFFPPGDPLAGTLQTFGVFALGFSMRPLGGVLFSHLGDRIGRRRVLAAVILLMGAATAAIGLLPTYAQVGVWAPILLTACRMVQGLSAGAETIGSNTLVAEHAPPRRRALYVSLSSTCINIPGIFAASLVLALTKTMGAAAFAETGWRWCFLLGGVFALVGLIIRFRVEESPEFERTRKADALPRVPVLESLREHPRFIALAFALSVLSGLGFYTMSGYMTTYLTGTAGLASTQALASNAIALSVLLVLQPLAGWASDVVGRGRMLTAGALAIAVVAYPAYLLAGSGTFAGAVGGQILLAAALATYFGPVTSAVLEIFPARVRFSAAALAFNLAYLLFAGTAPFVSAWLVSVTRTTTAPAVYLAAVGIVVAAVTLLFRPRGPLTDGGSR